MALVWTSKNNDIDSMRAHIDERLKQTHIPAFIVVSWKNDELSVIINHGGKSEFRLALSVSPNGLRIHETKRDIALLHRAFVGKVEKMIDKVLAESGFVRS
jgi:predicted TIM-barrel fold metal-dependent hydrolase